MKKYLSSFIIITCAMLGGLLMLCGCNGKETHTHEYAIKYDNLVHYKECTVVNCAKRIAEILLMETAFAGRVPKLRDCCIPPMAMVIL